MKMKIEINKLDFSWQIRINGKDLATVWMNHGVVKEEHRQMIHEFLMSLNTKGESE